MLEMNRPMPAYSYNFQISLCSQSSEFQTSISNYHSTSTFPQDVYRHLKLLIFKTALEPPHHRPAPTPVHSVSLIGIAAIAAQDPNPHDLRFVFPQPPE